MNNLPQDGSVDPSTDTTLGQGEVLQKQAQIEYARLSTVSG